jgi:hypothetical protein
MPQEGPRWQVMAHRVYRFDAKVQLGRVLEQGCSLPGVAPGVPPHPKRQPQERVEEPQPAQQRHGQHVSRIGQMEVKFGEPVAPVTAEQKGREAAASRSEPLLARFELSLAGGYSVQRRRLQPTSRSASGERRHQSDCPALKKEENAGRQIDTQVRLFNLVYEII